jgi:hypothetical protein
VAAQAFPRIVFFRSVGKMAGFAFCHFEMIILEYSPVGCICVAKAAFSWIDFQWILGVVSLVAGNAFVNLSVIELVGLPVFQGVAVGALARKMVGIIRVFGYLMAVEALGAGAHIQPFLVAAHAV